MNEPLTHGEFDQWQKEHFVPHVKQGEEHDKKVDRLSLGAFGDGNGNAGAFEDVKQLKRMAVRQDAWLDGVKFLGRALAWSVGILASVAVFLSSQGVKILWWLK